MTHRREQRGRDSYLLRKLAYQIARLAAIMVKNKLSSYQPHILGPYCKLLILVFSLRFTARVVLALAINRCAKYSVRDLHCLTSNSVNKRYGLLNLMGGPFDI